MSARKAFVLGAIVGTGVLAAVGAVSAGSSSSEAPASVRLRADAPPPALYADLKHIDKLLSNLISDERAKSVDADVLFERVLALSKAKLEMVATFFDQPVYGLTFSEVFRKLDCVDEQLQIGVGFARAGGAFREKVINRLALAQKCKQKLETALQKANPPPQKVSITEFDTWTHNTDIGKDNICINVKTTPPQAFISASVGGPGNYKANLPKTPLHADGTRQVGAEITQAGPYTDTLIVYDKSGRQTATTTKTFTVAAPPQDGPAPAFGPSCPKPTQ